MGLFKKLKMTFAKFNKKQCIDYKVTERKIMSWPCGSIQHEFDVPPDAECLGAYSVKGEGIIVLFRLSNKEIRNFSYDPKTNTSKPIHRSI